MKDALLALLFAAVVAEGFNGLSWLAKKAVRKSAFLRYGDTEFAHVRAEEWEAFIELRPFEVLKLGTALKLFTSGVYFATGRRAMAIPQLVAVKKKASAVAQGFREIFDPQFLRFTVLLLVILAASTVGAKRYPAEKEEIMTGFLLFMFFAYAVQKWREMTQEEQQKEPASKA